MKQLHQTSYDSFYKTNEFVAKTSPMRTHYESKNPLERWLWQKKLAIMKQQLSRLTYSRVIDIGCGDGGLLQTVNPKSHYTGVDISPTQLGHFKKHLPQEKLYHMGPIRLVQHDISSLPFAAKQFDLALACDVLEHVLNPSGVIREIKRVLKPGGYAFFSIPNEPMWQTARILTLKWPPRSPDHLYHITPDVILEAFDRIIYQEYLPFPVAPIHLIHLLLVQKSSR